MRLQLFFKIFLSDHFKLIRGIVLCLCLLVFLPAPADEGCRQSFSHSSKWISYKKAQNHVQSLGIRTQKQYNEWSKSGDRPQDIPSNPNRVYKKEWEGWTVFLLGVKKRQWRPYREVQSLVQAHGIKNEDSYRKWRRSSGLEDIPSRPQVSYREEWEGWEVFLGPRREEKKWRSYSEVQAHVQSLGIKTKRKYNEWSKSGDRPKDIPSDPQKIYKEEWGGWGIFLGTANQHKKKWRAYQKAKAYIRSLGLKNRREFRVWIQSGERPKDIPSSPESVYKEEWEGWGSFLGTGNKRRKKWRPYREAQDHVQSMGIRTQKEYNEWSKSGERPQDIPSDPQKIYKEEWEGWKIFLGTGNKRRKKWRPYREAQDHVQSLGIRTQKEYERWSVSGDRPEDIPFHPREVYSYYWKGWRSFLGQKQPIMPYKKARAYIRKKNMTAEEFYQWLKTDQRPKNFPRQPHIAYEDQWINVENFLGIQWMDFKSAQVYVQFLNVLSPEDYFSLSQSKEEGEGLPPDPSKAYPEDWQGWDHFLFGE